MLKGSEKLIGEIEALLKLASETVHENISQAIAINEKALFKSHKLKQKDKVHADALNQLSSIQRKNKEFSTASGLAKRAIEVSNKVKYQKGLADGKFNLAKILLNENKPSEALPLFLESSNIFQNLKDQDKYAKSLCLLGQVYEQFRDFKSAKENYQKALEISIEEENNILKSSIYLYLANASLALSKYHKAAQYIEKSFHLKEIEDSKVGLSYAYLLKGKVKFKLKEAESALSSLDFALELFKQQENRLGMVEAYLAIGKVYVALREFTLAKEFSDKAMTLSEELNSVKWKYKSHHLLSKVHKEEDPATALDHLEQYVELKEQYDEAYIQNMIDSYEIMSKIDDEEKDEELEQAKASIIQSKNSEMDSFFYRVSHDLKGPIASLLGLSELAKKDIKDKDALLYLGMYENQIKRLNMIVMELINITELNYREKQLSKINFYEIIDNCISAYTYLPNFDKIKFEIDIASDLNFSSEWYIVNTILQNLIENSIKYIDIEKSEQLVKISVGKKRNNVIIRLNDNGLGIPAEHQDKIFEMFFRASNNAEGTGLGLFILKRAVERLKGEVSLQSQVGKGAEFMISLPIQ